MFSIGNTFPTSMSEVKELTCPMNMEEKILAYIKDCVLF